MHLLLKIILCIVAAICAVVAWRVFATCKRKWKEARTKEDRGRVHEVFGLGLIAAAVAVALVLVTFVY